MDDTIWKKLYDSVSVGTPNPVIVGYNINLDRVITVTPALLRSTRFNQPVLAELRSRLLHSMHTCTAEEWFVTDHQRYQQFIRIFADSGHLVIGGQAGIAAVHLSMTGISDVLCIAQSVGLKTGKILDSSGVHVLDLNGGCGQSSDIIHLVFEYSPGLVPVADGVIPRNNRFIASPVHSPESVIIPGDKMDAVIATISRYSRVFLSGYQYLQTDEEFKEAADQIALMKKSNSHMRIHVECVSVSDPAVINGFIRHILPVADSIGLNEHELVLLLCSLDSPDDKPVIFESLSPVQLVQGAREICIKTGLKRLHLHTFGYYVLIIRNDCADPEASRNALLFASRATANAAQGTRREISPVGISACEMVSGIFGPEVSTGIFKTHMYTIVIIPTIVAQDIAKSSGLGDILSSSAFVIDQF